MGKKKKSSSSNFWPFFLLVILPLLAIGLSGLAIAGGIQNYVTTSHYFRVKELRVEGITDQKYLNMIKDEVVGSNIFRINAGELAWRIKSRFPNFYYVSVERVLPSQLFILAKERLPVAWIKRDRSYLLDANGVIVGEAGGDITYLPLLTGLEENRRQQKLKTGAVYSARGIHRPLLLAKILKLRSASIRQAIDGQTMEITRIDATRPNELSFFLSPDQIEVKVGDRNFDVRVALLPAILQTISADKGNIKYIDLRPREPVVATKDKPRNT